MTTALLLVDLSALFWWSWFSSKHQSIDAPFELVLGKVRQLASRYSHVAVCCDAGRSFRYELDPEYKGKRPPKDEAGCAQLARVIAELKAMGFQVLEAGGFEGDDLIATVAAWACEQDPPIEVVIAGQDKDLLSLLSDRVSLLHIQNGVLVRPENVRVKFGVGPEQMRDYLALVGDTADNIKGVPKIGAEHAKRLLGEFGSVTRLLRALDEKNDDGSWKVRPDSIRESLLANVGLLDQALKLVTLRTDAPILEALAKFDLCSASRIRPVSDEGRPTSDGKAQQPPTRSQPPAKAPPSPPPAQASRPRPPSRFSAASVTRAPDRSKHKIIFTGRSGVGKTHFVSTIPGVFIVPIEEGLKGASPDHEPAHFKETPRTIGELHQALDVFAELNSADAEGRRQFPHLALDSLSGIERLVHEAACGAEKVRHMEAKDFKKVWSAAEPFWFEVQAKLDAIRRTGVHIWIIAHSAETVDASTTSGEIYRRWDIQLKGTGTTGVEARQMWRAWADHVFFLDWAVEVQKGSKTSRAIGRYKGRILHTRESASYYAKTRLRLPPSLPATWEDLAKAWAAGVAAPDAKLRAELNEVLPQLAPEDREAIEAELGTAAGNKLSALVSRAHGMLAVALEDAPAADAAE
ncbi:5'-3' exonuclease H3TH domain-containing protein [Sorangium sp. So ce406]|uniref:5'-3' exonuclease H3TH domain-containing protein n=1 Tax=Sorangium sp. So ce406 TaxID=3133311 RepID=UPI003F5C837D